jgi:hypothetical protein
MGHASKAEKKKFAAEQFERLKEKGFPRRIAGEIMQEAGPRLAVASVEWLQSIWDILEAELAKQERRYSEGIVQERDSKCSKRGLVAPIIRKRPEFGEEDESDHDCVDYKVRELIEYGMGFLNGDLNHFCVLDRDIYHRVIDDKSKRLELIRSGFKNLGIIIPEDWSARQLERMLKGAQVAEEHLEKQASRRI